MGCAEQVYKMSGRAIGGRERIENFALLNTYIIVIIVLKNYTTEDENTEEIDKPLLEVLRQALLAAELFVKTEKQAEMLKNLMRRK